MRIRRGFVSNSSSSSFVLSTDLTKDLKINITLEIDLNHYAECVAKTEDEVREYIAEEWCWGGSQLDDILATNESLREIYDASIAAVKAGKIVVFGEVGNESGDELSRLLYDRDLKKLFEGTAVVVIHPILR